MKKSKEKKASVLQRLLPYAGKKKPLLYIAMILSAVSAILILMPMVFINNIVKILILNGSVDIAFVKENSICAAIFAIIGIILYISAVFISHIFAFEVENNIIKLSVKRLINKPLGYFSNKESGRIRNIIVAGAAETHSFLAHQLPDLASTIVSPIVLLVFFFMFDWKLGIASLIPVIILMFIMASLMNKKYQKLKDEYYTDLANLSAQTVEYVRGIPVVKVFAQSVESFKKLYALINQLKDCTLNMTMGFRNKMAWYETLSVSTSFFIVPVALLLIKYGGNINTVVANSVIYFLIAPTFSTFLMRSATLTNYTAFARLSLDKIDNLLDSKEFGYGDKDSNNASIEFKNVSFSYDKEKILDNISFKANKGERIALVGASGGGKTTIARLAARFYDVDEGEILIGGLNIKEYNKQNLMNKIAFVFQSTTLFKMSIRDNILMGNNASENELKEAIINSGSQEIIDKLPNGIDTIYGSKGTYLSGGEIQRIAIARAFLKNADIIILDEATAFADPENEHIIQESFKKLSKNKTTIMIAHRLSSIVDADRILVVDNGKIVEEGNHEQLLNKNGLYNKLWDEYQKSVNWKIGGPNA